MTTVLLSLTYTTSRYRTRFSLMMEVDGIAEMSGFVEKMCIRDRNTDGHWQISFHIVYGNIHATIQVLFQESLSAADLERTNVKLQGRPINKERWLHTFVKSYSLVTRVYRLILRKILVSIKIKHKGKSKLFFLFVHTAFRQGNGLQIGLRPAYSIFLSCHA